MTFSSQCNKQIGGTGKYDSCEHCQKPRLEGQLLSAVEYWVLSQYDGRRRTSYWLVCDDCYETRQQWCVEALPDSCEKCGSRIALGEHHFEGKYNCRGKEIAYDGLDPDETCRIVCEPCFTDSISKNVEI
jgi:hypothetical protein